jgi:hypothetical protein
MKQHDEEIRSIFQAIRTLMTPQETSERKIGLLVHCLAFRGKSDRFPNLTTKKIPNAVLKRCEWGHDDYSLWVENLPKAPPNPVQLSLLGEEGEP